MHKPDNIKNGIAEGNDNGRLHEKKIGMIRSYLVPNIFEFNKKVIAENPGISMLDSHFIDPEKFYKSLGVGSTNVIDKNTMDRFNSAKEKAIIYMRDILKLHIPKNFCIPVHSKMGIDSFIKNANEHDDKTARAISFGILSVVLAQIELRKKAINNLREEMGYIEKRFFWQSLEEQEENQGLFCDVTQKNNSGREGPINFSIPGVDSIMTFTIRGKSDVSMLMKFLKKPEANAESASKDAIAMRIVIDKEKIGSILEKILEFLIAGPFQAININIENKSFLDDAEYNDLKENIIDPISELYDKDIYFDPTNKNPNSADSYRFLNIIAEVLVHDDKLSTQQYHRSIEIQFHEPDSSNETKRLSSHYVYALKGLITVMTRLFGGCSKQWIRNQLPILAKKENIELSAEIVDNITEEILGLGDYIRIPDSKGVYASVDVYKRWLESGLLQGEFEQKIKRCIEKKEKSNK